MNESKVTITRESLMLKGFIPSVGGFLKRISPSSSIFMLPKGFNSWIMSTFKDSGDRGYVCYVNDIAEVESAIKMLTESSQSSSDRGPSPVMHILDSMVDLFNFTIENDSPEPASESCDPLAINEASLHEAGFTSVNTKGFTEYVRPAVNRKGNFIVTNSHPGHEGSWIASFDQHKEAMLYADSMDSIDDYIDRVDKPSKIQRAERGTPITPSLLIASGFKRVSMFGVDQYVIASIFRDEPSRFFAWKASGKAGYCIQFSEHDSYNFVHTMERIAEYIGERDKPVDPTEIHTINLEAAGFTKHASAYTPVVNESREPSSVSADMKSVLEKLGFTTMDDSYLKIIPGPIDSQIVVSPYGGDRCKVKAIIGSNGKTKIVSTPSQLLDFLDSVNAEIANSITLNKSLNLTPEQRKDVIESIRQAVSGPEAASPLLRDSESSPEDCSGAVTPEKLRNLGFIEDVNAVSYRWSVNIKTLDGDTRTLSIHHPAEIGGRWSVAARMNGENVKFDELLTMTKLRSIIGNICNNPAFSVKLTSINPASLIDLGFIAAPPGSAYEFAVTTSDLNANPRVVNLRRLPGAKSDWEVAVATLDGSITSFMLATTMKDVINLLSDILKLQPPEGNPAINPRLLASRGFKTTNLDEGMWTLDVNYVHNWPKTAAIRVRYVDGPVRHHWVAELIGDNEPFWIAYPKTMPDIEQLISDARNRHEPKSEPQAKPVEPQAEPKPVEPQAIPNNSICAYCSESLGVLDSPDSRANFVKHMETCDKHPYKRLLDYHNSVNASYATCRKERDELRLANDKLTRDNRSLSDSYSNIVRLYKQECSAYTKSERELKQLKADSAAADSKALAIANRIDFYSGAIMQLLRSNGIEDLEDILSRTIGRSKVAFYHDSEDIRQLASKLLEDLKS